MQYPRPLSVESMDFDPSWTTLKGLNRVDCMGLSISPLSFFFRGLPTGFQHDVCTLFRSLWMLSIAPHRVGGECPTRDRKPLFQDSQILLVLDPLGIVVRWTFRSSGENSRAILLIRVREMALFRPAGWRKVWYVLFFLKITTEIQWWWLNIYCWCVPWFENICYAIDLNIKLDRAVSSVWIGRYDQTALTSGKGKSSVEAAALRVLNLRIRTFIVMCAL